MDQAATRQAQRLTDAFNHFNRVSEQLTNSNQLLERHLTDISRRVAAGDRESPPAVGAHTQPVHQLQPILDALPAGVVVLDGNGRIAQCNQAALDLLGAPLAGAGWFEIIQRSFAAQGPLGDLRLTDGRLVALATNPLVDEPGQVILINEVTDSRAIQDLVQRQRRLASLGDMTSALAHQIRTPLAASLLYVSQLEQCGMSSPVRHRVIGKIRTCLDHLDKLVRDMLMFARGGCFSAGYFSAASLLDAFRQMSVPLLHDSGCRLQITDDCGDAQLRGNPDALVAVLQNILVNAIQACRGVGAAPGGVERRGQLSFLARRIAGPDAIEFLLKDNGPGIDPAVRDRILEPFFTTKPQGTGLGLAVAQAVVSAHDGALWIESEPGGGTCVGIRLPLAASATDAGYCP